MAHTDRFERISEIVRLEKAARERLDINACFAMADRFQHEYLGLLHEIERSAGRQDADAAVAAAHVRVLAMLEGENELRRLLGPH